MKTRIGIITLLIVICFAWACSFPAYAIQKDPAILTEGEQTSANHVHNLVYTCQNNTITVECNGGDQCPIKEATLTLNMEQLDSEGKVKYQENQKISAGFDSSELLKFNQLVYGDNQTDDYISDTNIKYYKLDNDSQYGLLPDKELPSDAGSYKAKFTFTPPSAGTEDGQGDQGQGDQGQGDQGQGGQEQQTNDYTIEKYFVILQVPKDKPAKPQLQATGTDQITVTNAEKGARYTLLDVNDQPVGDPKVAENNGDMVFSGLTPDTEYKVAAYMPAGDENHTDSDSVTSDPVKTLREESEITGTKTLASGNYKNLTIKNGANVTITGPVTVEGNLVIEAGAVVYLMGKGTLTQVYQADKPDYKSFQNNGAVYIDGTTTAALKIPSANIQASGNGTYRFVGPDKKAFTVTFGKTLKEIVTSPYCSTDNHAPLNAGKAADYSVTFVPGGGNWSFPAKVNISVNKAALPYPGPNKLTAIHGQTLSDISAKLASGFAFVKSGASSTGNVGSNKFYINYKKQSSYADPRKNPANYQDHEILVVVNKSEGEILAEDLGKLNVTVANLDAQKIKTVSSLKNRYKKLSSIEKKKVSKNLYNKIGKAEKVIKHCTLQKGIYFRFSKGTFTVFGKGKIKNLFSTFVLSKKAKQVKKRKYQKKYASKIRKVVVEDGITYIGNGYFAYLPKLQSVQLQGNKKKITLGKSVFFGCKNLKSANVTGVKKMGFASFAQCTRLQKVSGTQNLSVLDNSVFSECSSLKILVLSSKVKKMGSYCFFQCYRLSSLSVEGGVSKVGKDVFFDAGKKVAAGKRVIKSKKTLCASFKKQAAAAGYTVKK